MSYSQSRPPSQNHPSYQRTPYDNIQPVSQPGWNSSDDIGPPSSAAAAAAGVFENYTQFPRDARGYNDASVLHAEEQIPQSSNYSQYLDFGSLDTGPTAAGGSSPGVMSQPLFGANPIATVNPEQYADIAIKTEQIEPGQLIQQEANQSVPAYSPSMNLNLNLQDNGTLARICGDIPTCAHILESPDLDMEDLNLCEWHPSSTLSPVEMDNQLNDPPRKPNAKDGTGIGTSTWSSSSSAATTAAAVTSSKKPRKRGRKPMADDDDEAQARAKQAHSIVERRYRDNLNGKIMQLHRTLSSIAGGNQNREADCLPDGDELIQKPQDKRTGGGIGARVRKSDVMTDAVNYVHQSEVQMRHMENEISRLTERVRTLEKLVRCEDCVVLKEMVRRSLQAQGRTQAQGRAHQGM
ncbi:hypothetical protein A1O7_07036 [Cladophialophora yegresii CBS 114405]|uniref:BHLH domain-containing protein n=1 Tax=Cladophialophora yegresii CBS 114405 TaxID=1182544 RepID=W9VLW1_9EURO|nr:uncharacterized protein A1O7_07036 [Cladophialophora yegresii CBS 114405]EXJ56692.1 hypothetical protein A1O7_07036 [Cladophialophora yegresii CBS 114405]